MCKPFSSAAASNRHAILGALRTELKAGDHVLEIGSGSGQHACHFAANLPMVHWQPSDLPAALPGIDLWLREAACANLAEPIALDVMAAPWPDIRADLCFTANTLHIISLPAVAALFAGCAQVLARGGRLCAYGPFAFNGRHVSQSNADFSDFLQQRDPDSAVRDVTDLNRLAAVHGFQPARALALPSNNHLLVFQR